MDKIAEGEEKEVNFIEVISLEDSKLLINLEHVSAIHQCMEVRPYTSKYTIYFREGHLKSVDVKPFSDMIWNKIKETLRE